MHVHEAVYALELLPAYLHPVQVFLMESVHLTASVSLLDQVLLPAYRSYGSEQLCGYYLYRSLQVLR